MILSQFVSKDVKLAIWFEKNIVTSKLKSLGVTQTKNSHSHNLKVKKSPK